METMSGFYGLSQDDLKRIAKSDITVDEQAMVDAVLAVDGLISLPEMISLYRICKLLPEDSKILEIGSFTGASAVAMGKEIQDGRTA